MLRKLFILLAMLPIPSVGHSAEIEVGNDKLNNAAIFISGEIKKGDYIKVKSKAKSFTNYIVEFNDEQLLQFILNSEGGDVEEAIKIGYFIRQTLAPVYVQGNKLIHESENEAKKVLSNRSEGHAKKYGAQNSVIYSDKNPITAENIKKCHSACVLILLGGVKKRIEDNYYWINDYRADEESNIPVIGLHRPYFSQKQYAELDASKAEASYKKLESVVRRYLEDVGATRELTDRIFKSASNEIDLVKAADFRRMSLEEEPFFTEWILAKCGVVDDGKGLLSENDYEYMKRVKSKIDTESRRLLRLHGDDYEKYSQAYNAYFPDGFSKDRYSKITTAILMHKWQVWECERSAVRAHQINFFSDHK